MLSVLSVHTTAILTSARPRRVASACKAAPIGGGGGSGAGVSMGCEVPPHPPWVAEATVSALVRVLGGANADGQKEATRSLRALGRRHGSALTNGMRAAVARRVIGVGCMRARLEFLRRAAVEQMGGYCSESDDAESASSDTDSDGDSDSDSEASSDADGRRRLRRRRRRERAEVLLALYVLHEERRGEGACAGDEAFVASSGVGCVPALASLQQPGLLDALALAAPGAVDWPEEPVARLAATCSLPEWLAERLVSSLGAEESLSFGEAINTPGPVTLRFNAAAREADPSASRETLAERLAAEEGLRCVSGVLSPHALSATVAATGGPPRSIWAIGAWKDGLFEVQDEGSQLIAAAVEAVPGERVLDLCAGNGGKSLALAAAVGPSGIVYVHDVKAYRIRALLANARRAGVEERIRVVTPGQLAENKFCDGRPHAVLVDAPCSSTGALRRRPALRWLLEEHHTVRGRGIWVLQKSLVAKASTALAAGGRLVYATCSVDRRENEGVAEAFEESAPGTDFEMWTFPEGTPGAREAPRWRHCRQMLPHVHSTDGFFMARWRRE